CARSVYYYSGTYLFDYW
nr:immunoglobulin heavy chain junction region [Macaca mulatta]